MGEEEEDPDIRSAKVADETLLAGAAGKGVPIMPQSAAKASASASGVMLSGTQLGNGSQGKSPPLLLRRCPAAAAATGATAGATAGTAAPLFPNASNIGEGGDGGATLFSGVEFGLAVAAACCGDGCRFDGGGGGGCCTCCAIGAPYAFEGCGGGRNGGGCSCGVTGRLPPVAAPCCASSLITTLSFLRPSSPSICSDKLDERTCEKSAAARAGSSGPVFERCYYYRMLFRVFLYLVR